MRIPRAGSLLVFACLACLIYGSVNLFHTHSRFLELFDLPRMLLLTAGLSFFTASFAVEARLLKTLALGVVAITLLASTVSFSRIWQLPASGVGNLSVLNINLLAENSSYEEFAALVDKEQPDILVVFGFNLKSSQVWDKQMRAISYSARVSVPRDNGFGMGIFSKNNHPPRCFEPVSAGSYQTPLFWVECRDYLIIAAHPLPPLSEENAELTQRYLEKVAEITNTSEKPVIVAGMFYTPYWSPRFLPLTMAKLKPANYKLGEWVWPGNDVGEKILQQNDILVRGFTIHHFRTLRTVGSNSFPVKAELSSPGFTSASASTPLTLPLIQEERKGE